MANVTTLNSHSGYNMPFHFGSNYYHDFHHEKFNYCFGVLGVLDYIHGTDSLFKQKYGMTKIMGVYFKKEL